VHVSDESVFATKLDSKNPKIIDHGRLTKDEVVRMDKKIDKGDGPKKGKLRWYVCRGIDCDEGWESVFHD
jgi:hypothetical protein